MPTDRKSSTPKIAVTKNGPYIVSGNVPISQQSIAADAEGTATALETKADYGKREVCALCRCGQSANKPFCDGTHAKIGFEGTESAGDEEYLDKPDVVEGEALRLVDAKELCASARFCHKDGGIWKLVPKSADPKSAQVACEEAAACPSGRLTIVDKKTGKALEPALEPSIVVLEDSAMGVGGPFYVQGGIPVESAQGKQYRRRNRVTLCRCGKSGNKPFCDSSHYPE